MVLRFVAELVASRSGVLLVLDCFQLRENCQEMAELCRYASSWKTTAATACVRSTLPPEQRANPGSVLGACCKIIASGM